MREMKLHVNYCQTFGISEAEIRATEEKQGVLYPSPFVISLNLLLFALLDILYQFTSLHVVFSATPSSWGLLSFLVVPNYTGG